MDMDYTNPIIDEFNAITGVIVALLSYILGEHWVLFAAFLSLNVADWITGWMKAHITGKKNSDKGWRGVAKKLGYWIMIAVSFGTSSVFIEIGKAIDVDLHVTTLLGWFVLASLLINEIRSIIENFVEAGFEVPQVLVKGLEAAEKVVKAKDIMDGTLQIDTTDPETDRYLLNLETALEDVKEKETITLRVDKNAHLDK